MSATPSKPSMRYTSKWNLVTLCIGICLLIGGSFVLTKHPIGTFLSA